MGLELTHEGDRSVATVDLTDVLDRMSRAFHRVRSQSERAGVPILGSRVLERTASHLDEWGAIFEGLAATGELASDDDPADVSP